MGIAGNPQESPGSCQGAGVQEFVGVQLTALSYNFCKYLFEKFPEVRGSARPELSTPLGGGRSTFLDFFFFKISLLSVAPSTFLGGMGDVVESCKLLSRAMEDTNPVWLARTW